MADFSDINVAPAPHLLDNVAALVARIRELTRLQAEYQSLVDQCTTDLNKLTMFDVPDAMAAAGLTEMRLTDGSLLKVKDDLKVTVNQANAAEAYAWLRDNGHGEVIKSDLMVDLRAVDEAHQRRLIASLQKWDIEFGVKESVHAATLKSLVRGMLEEGVTPPTAISIYQFKKAEVKEPKK